MSNESTVLSLYLRKHYQWWFDNRWWSTVIWCWFCYKPIHAFLRWKEQWGGAEVSERNMIQYTIHNIQHDKMYYLSLRRIGMRYRKSKIDCSWLFLIHHIHTHTHTHTQVQQCSLRHISWGHPRAEHRTHDHTRPRITTHWHPPSW